MSTSKLCELSTDFAVKVIKLCETIKGHYSLVNQLERSATSIGANVREANYAHGKHDLFFCPGRLSGIHGNLNIEFELSVRKC